MGKKVAEVFTCDRCGASAPAREDRRSEDDEGFPERWAHVTFWDGRVNWKKDLCIDCANTVGQRIRTTRFD